MNIRVIKINSKRPGFTLIETIISLIVIAVGILLINLFLGDVYHNQIHYSDEVHFYSYLSRFEAPDYKLIKVNSSRLLLKNCQTHKEYQIRIKKHILLLTGINNKGYVPLISDVDSIYWSYHHHLLNTSIMMGNHNKYRDTSFIKFGE